MMPHFEEAAFVFDTFDTPADRRYGRRLMTRFRRALRILSGLWLCCQTASLAAASVVLDLEAPAGAVAVECTCALGDHDACPMHHPAHSPGSPSNCRWKNSRDPAAAIVIVIVGPSAVVPRRIVLDTPRSASVWHHAPDRRVVSTILAPDGPPPRA
jgi:hypothetical protein